MTPRFARRWLAAAGAVLTVVLAAAAPEGRAPTARQRFEAAKTAEAQARAAAILVDDAASEAARERTLTQARRVATQYEAIVRRFPTSSYSDDALHQAASLLQWLHGRFGRDADRMSASKYLAWLMREYPGSKHVRDAKVAARALEHPAPRPDTAIARTSQTPAAARPRAAAAVADVTPAAMAVPDRAPGLGPVTPDAGVPAAATTAAGSPSGPPTLRGISRAVLDDTVRVTLALDREAPFTHEILAGPPRAFVDLFGASTIDALQDASVKYDADAVRQVRVGKRPGAVRVVLDLTEATRVSVYTLYNPFRVVIDADRAKTARTSPPSPTVAAAPAASSSPAVAAARTAPTRSAAVTRATPPARPVPSPEPLPAPVAVPAEPPVVLTVETAGDAAVHEPVAVAAADPISEPPPAVTASAPREAGVPTREPAAAPAVSLAAAPAGGDVVPAVAAPPKPVSSPAMEMTPPAGADAAPAASSRPPSAPSANTDGSFSLARQLGLGVSRIVIDPGHGGHDPGTLAHGSSEAKLVLDVALRLEKLLEREGLEVVLTRRTDVFIPLEERTAIANRERADLFLSIHANASRDPKARGIETYYLSFASNPDAETVAARENATSSGGMHNLPSIVRAIALNNKLDESRDLAGMVQRALSAHLSKGADGSRSRGIKKAPFVVLIGAAMPSVLAEIGFITNRTEAGHIKTAPYRQRIAEALRDAVVQYQRSLKRATTVATAGR